MTSTDEPVAGVGDPRRLAAVARLALGGHLGDPGLDAAVDTVAASLAVPMAAVNIVTPGLQTYAAEIGIGVPCTDVPDDRSFCAEVVGLGLPLVVHDAAAHPVYRDNPLVRAGRIGAYAGFPLVHRGAVLGSVCAFAVSARDFSPTDLRVLAAQARLASSVLALRHAATHDALTGLANRARVAEVVEQALASPPVSVLFADVDDFKAVNDAHGHHAGDEALRVLARRMEVLLDGVPHLAARWGGDEFLVVLPGADADRAKALADRLVATAAHGRPPVAVGLTVGTATAGPGDELLGVDALVRLAGAASAEGKRAGKGQAHSGASPDRLPSVRRATRG